MGCTHSGLLIEAVTNNPISQSHPACGEVIIISYDKLIQTKQLYPRSLITNSIIVLCLYRYGPIYSVRLGRVMTVVLSDPRLIREALGREEFAGRADLYLTHGIMQGYGEYVEINTL